jgi:hypothetical protein
VNAENKPACSHKRIKVEDDRSYRERVNLGEDPAWYNAECKDCGAAMTVKTPYQIDREFEVRSWAKQGMV